MCSKVVSENNCQMLVSSGINAGIACAYGNKKKKKKKKKKKNI